MATDPATSAAAFYSPFPPPPPLETCTACSEGGGRSGIGRVARADRPALTSNLADFLAAAPPEKYSGGGWSAPLLF